MHYTYYAQPITVCYNVSTQCERPLVPARVLSIASRANANTSYTRSDQSECHVPPAQLYQDLLQIIAFEGYSVLRVLL